MLDLGHTIDQGGRFQSFSVAGGGTNNFQRFEWHKPRGVSMIALLGLGAGGAGGNGFNSVTDATLGTGGGGGGSGGQTFVMIPAFLVPDVLYVQCPRGRIQGDSAPPSTAVSISPSTTAQDTILIANTGGNGGNAAAGVAGVAGTAGAIATLATMPRAGLGVYKMLVGQAGAAGDVSYGGGGSITVATTGLIVTGGAGGGGSNATLNFSQDGVAGGDVYFPYDLRNSPAFRGGAVAVVSGGVAVDGNHGSSGWVFVPGLALFAGGAGGGGAGCYGNGVVVAAANGGNGGRGYFGCGGGGGGAGGPGYTAGAGGHGGSGLVIIQCW